MLDFAAGSQESAIRNGLAPVAQTPPAQVSVPSGGDPRVTTQSGLPLYWSDAGPLVAPDSAGRRLALRVKRVMDVVLSLGAIVMLSPLFLAIALAIWLTSPGPVLFRQSRTGRDGKIFRIYKFRTMRLAEQDPSGVSQTTHCDCRVTTVGLLLRRRNFDELPQLINVLRGEMSIIGPRPHVPHMLAAGTRYDELVPYYDLRHAMLPGLSGWAQANGFRGPTVDALKARARVNHDVAYVQNFSLWLDLRIIVLTLQREIVGGTGF